MITVIWEDEISYFYPGPEYYTQDSALHREWKKDAMCIEKYLIISIKLYICRSKKINNYNKVEIMTA